MRTLVVLTLFAALGCGDNSEIPKHNDRNGPSGRDPQSSTNSLPPPSEAGAPAPRPSDAPHERGTADADAAPQPGAPAQPDASQSAGPSAAGRTYTAPVDHDRVPVQQGTRAVEIDNDTATMQDDRPGERYEIRGN